MTEKKKNPATRKHFTPETKCDQERVKGRPPIKIDADMVLKLAETMLPVESIAAVLGCSKDTLYSRFPDVLQKAREGRKQSLSMAMWEKALINKDTTMLIWLSKQHLGYKEKAPEAASQINFNVYCKEIPK